MGAVVAHPCGNGGARGKQRGHTARFGWKAGSAGQRDALSAQTAPRAPWRPVSHFCCCHRLSVSSQRNSFTFVAAEFPVGNGGAHRNNTTTQRETQKRAQEQGLEIMIFPPRRDCCLLNTVVRLLFSSLLCLVLSAEGYNFNSHTVPSSLT